MTSLILIFSLLSGVGVKSKQLKPTIVSQDRVAIDNCVQDPLSPCEAIAVIVENPAKTAVKVKVKCGPDDEADVELKPQTMKLVFINLTMPLLDALPCKLQ